MTTEDVLLLLLAFAAFLYLLYALFRGEEL
jgi:hypothetical protein